MYIYTHSGYACVLHKIIYKYSLIFSLIIGTGIVLIVLTELYSLLVLPPPVPPPPFTGEGSVQHQTT